MNDKMFGLIKYSSIYCKMDCKVLMHGYEVLRGWMLERTGLDVDSFITIQSMASTFMLKPGCYDDVYQLSGATQQFITRCVVGGRVMTNSNKQYNVKGKIADFDACSLYPSAMYFMEGFLQGLPQVLKDTSYDFLKKQQDGYFIRVRTIKLNRHLDFPLISKLNEDDGVRNFTNDMENETMYVYKAGLEDLITYHEAESEVLDGCYFKSGRHNRVNDVIKDLYDLRKKLNNYKNPAQIVKLLMNSMYGKTIIKPIETDTIIKDTRAYFEKYMSYEYNYIDSVLEVKGRYYIKEIKSILSHFNYVHCGVEILSMSKRIMNKVFSCAGENNINIYYQDTDSIHLNYDDVDKVVEIYKETDGSELVGKELGNFHVDFDMDGADSEIYAIESLFLGKKTYIYIF